MGGGSEGNRSWCESARCIKDLMIFTAGFFQDVLWCEEHVRAESCNPQRERDNVAITLFLVHCGHDLLAFLVDGRMVSHAPVKEGIISRCRCIEDGGCPRA